MAADRRTPVTKAGKSAARKTPANTAAASAVAATVATKSAAAAHAPKATAVKSTAPAAKPVPAGLYALEDQVGFHLRRAHQRATVIFNEVMAQFDITPTQFAALAKIDDEGSISQNHLGRLTAMSSPAR